MSVSTIYREDHYCRCGGALHLTSDRQTVAGVAALWWAIHNGSRHGLATQVQAAKARRAAWLEERGRCGG